MFKRDGVLAGVDGLDTEHLVPLVRTHVRQFLPGVEYNCGVRIGLRNGNLAPACTIVDDAGGGGIGIDAVSECRESKRSVSCGLVTKVVRLIDKGRWLKSRYGDFVDI